MLTKLTWSVQMKTRWLVYCDSFGRLINGRPSRIGIRSLWFDKCTYWWSLDQLGFIGPYHKIPFASQDFQGYKVSPLIESPIKLLIGLLRPTIQIACHEIGFYHPPRPFRSCFGLKRLKCIRKLTVCNESCLSFSDQKDQCFWRGEEGVHHLDRFFLCEDRPMKDSWIRLQRIKEFLGDASQIPFTASFHA